jgi:hypothetical protein
MIFAHSAHSSHVLGLTIEVLDQPGSGGACHIYKIHGPRRNVEGLPEDVTNEDGTHKTYPDPCCIAFQGGPIAEAGVNGVSNEAILAVLIDRIQGFQSGEFSCRENAVALTHLETAMMWLQKRTRDRMARGVEGTMQK